MAKYPNVTFGQTEACINRLGGWDNFIRFIGGEGEVVWSVTKAPQPVVAVLGEFSTITIPVTKEMFVAREKFIRDTGRKAKVKIAYISDNFTNWFLAGNGTA